MSKLSLTIALNAYEHALDFLTGRVTAEGVDINWLRIPAAPVSDRFADNREFDVAEVPLAEYLTRLSRDDRSIVALPIFLSRQFMQGAVWVRADGPVRTIDDLGRNGVRCVADDETAATYVSHWLNDAVGFDRGTNLALTDTRSLQAKLSAGEIDAAVSLSRLSSGKDAGVKRLITDVSEAEHRYYQATGIFPILRVLCLHRDVAERHRWLPGSLFEAFDRAKRNSLGRLIGAGMSRYPLPWLNAYVTQTRAVFGDDFWPYGIDANRATLDAFLQTAKARGICRSALALEDLFWTPNTATAAVS